MDNKTFLEKIAAFANNQPKKRVRGAGDIVAAIAQPVASAIDALAGTNLKNCGGCKNRQERLNKVIPFKTVD